jgi:cold shock CspA family protein
MSFLSTEQTNEERKMQTGKVRMWSARGFGFLTPDDGTGDLFIHISSCVDGIDELCHQFQIGHCFSL